MIPETDSGPPVLVPYPSRLWAEDAAGARARYFKENGMKVSARDTLPGTVETVTPGTVNTEVVIELAPGRRVYAVIKSSDVMAATD